METEKTRFDRAYYNAQFMCNDLVREMNALTLDFRSWHLDHRTTGEFMTCMVMCVNGVSVVSTVVFVVVVGNVVLRLAAHPATMLTAKTLVAMDSAYALRPLRIENHKP